MATREPELFELRGLDIPETIDAEEQFPGKGFSTAVSNDAVDSISDASGGGLHSCKGMAKSAGVLAFTTTYQFPVGVKELTRCSNITRSVKNTFCHFTEAVCEEGPDEFDGSTRSSMSHQGSRRRARSAPSSNSMSMDLSIPVTEPVASFITNDTDSEDEEALCWHDTSSPLRTPHGDLVSSLASVSNPWNLPNSFMLPSKEGVIGSQLGTDPPHGHLAAPSEEHVSGKSLAMQHQERKTSAHPETQRFLAEAKLHLHYEQYSGEKNATKTAALAPSENPDGRQQRSSAISEIHHGMTHSNVSSARLHASLPQLIEMRRASEVPVEERSPRPCFFSKKKGRFLLLKEKGTKGSRSSARRVRSRATPCLTYNA
jgi:hypothetical protein